MHIRDQPCAVFKAVVDKYSDAQAKAHGVSEKPSIIITSIHRESVVVNRAGARKKKEPGKKLCCSGRSTVWT